MKGGCGGVRGVMIGVDEVVGLVLGWYGWME